MPVSMWFFLILAVIAAIVLGASFFFLPTQKEVDAENTKRKMMIGITVEGMNSLPPTRKYGIAATVVIGSLALMCLIIASVTVVGTRQIGIETKFGRPTGSAFSNGFHWKSPLTNVDEMDGAIQIDQHVGDKRIKVRLGNNSTADADVSVRWQMKPAAAPELFAQYKTFDNVRTNLVTRKLQVALNEVFATFDPLEEKNITMSPLPQIVEQAQGILERQVGNQIEILDVAIPTIDYDEGTENKINQINQSRAQTQVAIQDQKTAVEQSKANEALSKSIANDPNVLVSKCLDIAREKNLPLLCMPTGVTQIVPVR